MIQNAAKKPAKAQATVTLRNLPAELAESHKVPKKREVGHRAARMGRNPATGEAIKIKASKKVAFRAAKDLKEAV